MGEEMDGNMRCQLAVGLLVMGFIVNPAESQTVVSASGPSTEQYCNETYAYCVNLPHSGKPKPHEGDAPNHGVTVDLQQPGNQVWTFAYWDAALAESPQKAMLNRLGILLEKHRDGTVSIEPTTLDGLPAYRIRLSYAAATRREQEIVVAYRTPADKSKDTGIIYEIGLDCDAPHCAQEARAFETFVASFRVRSHS
jgi:hypothetical protein